MGHVTVIAELGSSPAPAWEFEPWVQAAAGVGADAVKVQIFRADHFPPGHQESKRPLEFPRGRYVEFVRLAHAYGLQAGASVFDTDAVAVALLGDFLKLAARERNNMRLRTVCQLTGRALYRSSDYLEQPQMQEIPFYAIQSYPASLPLSLWRLARASAYYRGMTWGWSSHTTGTLDCVLAVRLGASVIEKHFALKANDIEAGHSLQPAQFAAMVRAIRKGEH